MHPTVREYKIPLSVTGAGLLVASILAFAPALMAESDAEVLTKKKRLGFAVAHRIAGV